MPVVTLEPDLGRRECNLVEATQVASPLGVRRSALNPSSRRDLRNPWPCFALPRIVVLGRVAARRRWRESGIETRTVGPIAAIALTPCLAN